MKRACVSLAFLNAEPNVLHPTGDGVVVALASFLGGALRRVAALAEPAAERGRMEHDAEVGADQFHDPRGALACSCINK
jgi:hypothetical protein